MGLFDLFKKKSNAPQQVMMVQSLLLRKEEVGYIQMDVSLGSNVFFSSYSSRDGSLMRSGVGGLPMVGISSLVQFPGMFEQLIAQLPKEVLWHHLEHRRPDLENPLIFRLTFEGLRNDPKGKKRPEKIQQFIHWEDEFNPIKKDPKFIMAEHCVHVMQGLTNDWFFDVVTQCCLGLQSNCMPGGMISQQKMEAADLATWKRMLHQIDSTPNSRFLLEYPKGKVYTHVEKKDPFVIELSRESNGEIGHVIHPYRKSN